MRLRQRCRDIGRAVRRVCCGGLILATLPPLSNVSVGEFTIERDFVPAAGNCQAILFATDSLVAAFGCDGEELSPGIDYEVRGDSLCLKGSPADCDRWTLRFSRSYPLLGKIFALREYATTADRQPAATPADVAIRGPRRLSSNLQISGAKSFTADVSDRGRTNLSQGLTMSVVGDIGKDVTVRGSFSDRGLRENRLVTRRFSELESIYLEVASPRGRSVFGSFALKRDRFRFMSIERKVQGLQLEYRGSSMKTETAVTVPQGNFGSHEFTSEDGNYGPYRLRGPAGETGIAVVENSDQVWLNGVKLERGRDQDYYVDYLRGELYFTGRRVIDAGDRVRAEYEFQRLEYRKTLLTGASSIRSTDSARAVSIGFSGQVGARNDPLDFVLSEEDIALLTAAGDAAEAVVVSGATFAGIGQGDYTPGTDSLGVGRFDFVGAGNGDYRVVFSDDETGDYTYLGNGHYQYVGSGLGRYSPVRRLPLPESVQMAAVQGKAELFPSASLETEIAYSNYDRNRFSTRDDHDNSQIAGFAVLNLRPQSSAHSGGLSAEYLPAEFYRFSRLEVVDEKYLWQRSLTRVDDRRRVEGFYQVAADSGYSAGVSGGITREGDAFRSERAGVRTMAKGARSAFAALDADWAQSEEAGVERELFRILPGIRRKLYFATISAAGEYDQVRLAGPSQAATTTSKRELMLGGEAGGLNISGRLRENWENRGLWRLVDSKQSAVTQVARTLPGNRKIAATITLNRFRRGGVRQNYQTGLLDILMPQLLGGIDLVANYRLNRRGVSETNETYVKVDDGEGDYVLIDSVYVAQSRGDYIVITEQVGATRQSSEAEKRISLEGRLGKYLRSFLTDGVTLRYDVNMREIGVAPKRLPWEWLAPPKKLYSSGERFSQRSAVYRIQRYDRSLRLRSDLSYTRSRDQNNLDIKHPSLRRSEELNLGVSRTVGVRDVLTADISGRNRSWREENRLNLFMRERRLELGGVRYAGTFEYVLNGAVAREKADSLSLESVTIRLSPGVNCNLGVRGRIEVSTFALLVSEHNDQPLLLQMAEGFPVGSHWGGRLRIDLNLSKNFVFKVLAHCELREGESNRYFLRSELISKFQ